MGTTAAYYCIWNRGFTQDELKEKLKGISGSGKKEDDEFFQTLCRMCSPEVARQIWDDAEKARADFHAALWGKDRRRGIAQRLRISLTPNGCLCLRQSSAKDTLPAAGMLPGFQSSLRCLCLLSLFLTATSSLFPTVTQKRKFAGIMQNRILRKLKNMTPSNTTRNFLSFYLNFATEMS